MVLSAEYSKYIAIQLLKLSMTKKAKKPIPNSVQYKVDRCKSLGNGSWMIALVKTV